MENSSSYISPVLRKKIDAIKPKDVDLNDFIELILSAYLGTHCKHEHQLLCLHLPTNELGCMDLNKTLQLLNDINYGRKPEELYRVCLDCLRVKRIFK